ncbi:Uncharacterized protein TPAR_02061 [Tolypocladium paradoxum]|uniref:Peptidase S8/S53 domain-containing protein n=1 Tax=Tolypocladium paradoxum TaxID=94208 RepID=A0A2S4L5S6_9HYPO|nr:Uncharacterized protein TPAR_02061 [Tolypocladium paradoxum]
MGVGAQAQPYWGAPILIPEQTPQPTGDENMQYAKDAGCSGAMGSWRLVWTHQVPDKGPLVLQAMRPVSRRIVRRFVLVSARISLRPGFANRTLTLVAFEMRLPALLTLLAPAGPKKSRPSSAVKIPIRDGHGTHVAGTRGLEDAVLRRQGPRRLWRRLGLERRRRHGLCLQELQDAQLPQGRSGRLTLSGGFSQAINKRPPTSSRRAVFIDVAARNENQDAANESPASEPSACTVGGTAIDDNLVPRFQLGQTRRYPGSGGQHLVHQARGGTELMNDTSMTTPHVDGLAAYLGALEGLTDTKALCNRTRELTTQDAITNQPGGIANLLAFNKSK